jgi:hypothetical protein
MQRIFLKILAVALLMDFSAYGQSLGDIARENREKQSVENASRPQPAVITNKDLPRDPEADQNPGDVPPDVAVSSKPGNRSVEPRSSAQQRAIEQWKKQIVAQEDKIADLQARLDQLNASVHPVNGSAQFEGPSNRYQARQLERSAEIQLQVDAQKRKLAEMQEAARHAGMHTTVYDP